MTGDGAIPRTAEQRVQDVINAAPVCSQIEVLATTEALRGQLRGEITDEAVAIGGSA